MNHECSGRPAPVCPAPASLQVTRVYRVIIACLLLILLMHPVVLRTRAAWMGHIRVTYRIRTVLAKIPYCIPYCTEPN